MKRKAQEAYDQAKASLMDISEEEKILVQEGFRNRTLDELQQALAEEKLKANMISEDSAEIVNEYDQRKKDVSSFIYIYIYIV